MCAYQNGEVPHFDGVMDAAHFVQPHKQQEHLLQHAPRGCGQQQVLGAAFECPELARHERRQQTCQLSAGCAGLMPGIKFSGCVHHTERRGACEAHANSDKFCYAPPLCTPFLPAELVNDAHQLMSFASCA